MLRFIYRINTFIFLRHFIYLKNYQHEVRNGIFSNSSTSVYLFKTHINQLFLDGTIKCSFPSTPGHLIWRCRPGEYQLYLYLYRYLKNVLNNFVPIEVVSHKDNYIFTFFYISFIQGSPIHKYTKVWENNPFCSLNFLDTMLANQSVKLSPSHHLSTQCHPKINLLRTSRVLLD